MDSEKRALLAIVLSLLILFIYQYFLAPAPPKKKPVDTPLKQEQAPEVKQAPAKPAEPMKLEPLKPQQQLPQPVSPEKDIIVTSTLYTAVFSGPAAGLKSFRLHRYMDRIEQPAFMKYIKKLFTSGSSAAYKTPPQWKELLTLAPEQPVPLRAAFITAQGSIGSNDPFHTAQESVTVDSQHPESKLLFKQGNGNLPGGISCQKKFTFHDNDYRIDFDLIITNKSAAAIDGNAVVEWSHAMLADQKQQGGGFFGGQGSTETPPQFSYFINGNVEKTDFKDIKEEKTLEGDILWTAFEDKYFMTAIVPRKEAVHQVHVGTVSGTVLAYQLMFSSLSLKPGETKTYPFSLYLGPKEIGVLTKQNASLEKIINFGWFDIMAKPLLIAMNFFHRFIGNYGIVIILITIIIKILFWPLTHKSYQSMKDMQKLQPEMAKLKEKFKDKKDEMNREVMALYRKYKVNPLGGCLPILLQIPVFIALYRVLQDSIELRHANFISFWINDLSAHDPTYISPLLMGASMFYQQKMTPTTADPAQAKMMLMMPIVFTFMFLNFPSGLVIYWLVNNVLSIVQQLYINKKSHEAGGSEWTQSKSKPKPLKKQSQ